MKLPRKQKKQAAESTISLINIVFLMLIFFLVAGTLATPIDKALAPADTAELPMTPSDPLTIAIRADGSLFWRGAESTSEAVITILQAEGQKDVKIIPDRELPVPLLVEQVKALKEAGVEQVRIITIRGSRAAS
ncbi:ExbD/TolR family protein [Coralliovum pocilloporae]|uniref:ExbD/TolR family protein n=1 Tax=Coralliovum pocilloporae TaxID=3066369 RepID=UPI003306BCD0